MFIILIILISGLIFALRLLQTGVHIANNIASVDKRLNYKGSSKVKKVLMSIRNASLVIGEGTLHILLLTLRAVRAALISVGSGIILIDVVVFLVIMLASAGAYTLYFSENTSSASNYVQGEGSKNDSNSSSNVKVDTSGIRDDVAMYLEKLKQGWDSKVTQERVDIIMKGATRIGKSTYARGGVGRGGSSDDTTIFDCSSFVGWAYYMCGHKDVSPESTTATFTTHSDRFRQISVDDLIPGDLGLNNPTANLGNANHVGIYVGDDNGTKMFMHSTSSQITEPCPVNDGVRISTHPNFKVFYRYVGFD